MSWICSKSDFSTVASEVEPQAVVRRSHVGLCVVTEGLRRIHVVPEGQPKGGWWQHHAGDPLPAAQPLLCASGVRTVHMGKWFVYLFVYLFIYACRIVHLKAFTLNPLKGLWASPLLSVFTRGVCLCSPSGLGWDMGEVECWHHNTVSQFWLEEKESDNQKRFQLQKISPLPSVLFPSLHGANGQWWVEL